MPPFGYAPFPYNTAAWSYQTAPADIQQAVPNQPTRVAHGLSGIVALVWSVVLRRWKENSLLESPMALGKDVLREMAPTVMSWLMRLGSLYPHLRRHLGIVITCKFLVCCVIKLVYGYWEKLAQAWDAFLATIMNATLPKIILPSSDNDLMTAFREWLHIHQPLSFGGKVTACSVQSIRNQLGGSNNLWLADSAANANRAVIFHHDAGLKYFWYNNILFATNYKHELNENNSEDPTIWCLWCSNSPLKNLLEEICKQRKTANQVAIFTTQDGLNWMQSFSKDRRSIDSVYLEPALKEDLMCDMTEFFDPDTRAWYKVRGIPYRRGLLFYGKPGTGKSTLALALAAHFNKSVYWFTIKDNLLNDRKLADLFQHLEPQCIILLEDIDSAGVEREDKMREKIDDTQETTEKPKTWAKVAASHTGLETASHPFHDKNDEEKTTTSRPVKESKGVTLSGLLNTLDGATAPEDGQLVIMTTNHVHVLDEALYHDGRIDRRIDFTYAVTGQVREMFKFMYEPTNAARLNKNAPDPEFISQLADEFAVNLPENKFTCSELQSYFMKYKSGPKAAVDNLGKWVSEKTAEALKSKLPTMKDEGYYSASQPSSRGSFVVRD